MAGSNGKRQKDRQTFVWAQILQRSEITRAGKKTTWARLLSHTHIWPLAGLTEYGYEHLLNPSEGWPPVQLLMSGLAQQ